MAILILLGGKYLWILAWILQSIGYYFVLKAMKEDTSYAIIPFFAEWHISKFLFEKMRAFYRPLAIALIFIAAAFYLGPLKGMGKLLLIVAMIFYGSFLVRFYNRLRKAFGKSWIYMIAMLIFSPIFLFLVSFNSTFTKPNFEQEPQNFFTKMKNGLVTAITVIEVAAIAIGIGVFTTQQLQPRFMVNLMHNDIDKLIKDVKGDGNIMSREEALGANASIINTIPHSRDYFFKNHDDAEDVVVLTYIVGSNLENGVGLASANIRQMLDATSKGEHLSFVIEAGGSSRWFTNGIEENGNGRYLIKDGKLTKLEHLDPTLCLSEPKQLEDFLNWAKNTYPSKRYMLVLWDHGGGFSLGYAQDDLNKRKGQDSTMLVNEFTGAIKNSGIKFDMIGFDACLMQTIETALALEPYADYYIASEEVEGGLGWSYTSAFSKLAQDPKTPTLDFAKELISAFDVYNSATNDGKVNSSSTLSIVDLTMVKPVYAELEKIFDISDEAIKEDGEYYAEIALSASQAYTFHNNEQIDLVNYLRILDSVDYRGKICGDDACLGVADYVMAMVPYHNKNSAEGIYGVALTFPVKALSTYSNTYKQLKYFNMEKQLKYYNDYFSIMVASQQKKPKEANDLLSMLDSFVDHRDDEWYVEGFEDYDGTEEFVDLPLTETPNGYRVELPEKIRKIILSTKVAVYQKVDNDKLRYIGRDFIGYEGDDGEIYIGMDDSWIYLNGHLISYEAGQSRETDEGTVFTGTTKALLNGKDDIIIQIEWPALKEGEERTGKGSVLGYSLASEENAFMSKGYNEFKAGDRIQFYFDYYNEKDGSFSHTAADSNGILVSNPDRLTVEDEPLRNCDIVFFGVLTDAYQREMTTQRIEQHLD